MESAIQAQALAENAFPFCSSFFGNSEAGFVAGGHKQFQALQAKRTQPKFCDETRCSCGHAEPRPRRANPIAQVSASVHFVNSAQTDAAEKPPIPGIENSETVLGSLSPFLRGF